MRLTGLLFLLLPACVAHVAPGAVDAITAQQGDPARGKPLFEEHCAHCHGADGRKMKDASLPDTVAYGSDASLIEDMLKGPSIMPSFAKKLTPAQIADITAWLRTGLLKGGE